MKQQYNHYHIAQYLKNKYNRKGMSVFVDSIKKGESYPTLSLDLAQMRKYDKNVDFYFFGTQWPLNAEELGKCLDYFYYPDSMENEIKWLIYQVKRNKHKLSLFVNYRDQIESLILLGDYDKANQTLDQAYKDFGESLWYYEMKLIILNQQERHGEVYSLLTQINQSQKDLKTGYVPLLLYYINKRSVVDVPAYDFDMTLQNRMKRNITEFQKDRQYYFLFKLNMYQSLDSAEKSTNFLMDSTNSLVDRYLFLVNVLKTVFAKEENQRSVYAVFAYTLYNYTKDKSLYQFMAYSGAELPEDYYNKLFIDIIDKYYIGDYDKVCELCKRHIQNYDIRFDVVKFYCRSLVSKKLPFTPITEIENSLLNKIAKNLYNVMAGCNDCNYVYELYKLNKNIYSFNLASALDYYIKEERTEPANKILGLIESRTFDPYVCKLFNSEEQAEYYLKKGKEKFPESVVLSYNLKKLKGETTEEEGIVDYIRKIDNAQILFNKHDYMGCIEVMNDVLLTNSDCTPIIQTAVKSIYESYVNLGKVPSAINFYVKWLVENDRYVTKISTDTLIERIKESNYNDLRLSINLVIFVLKNAQQQTDRVFIVEQYSNYKEFSTIESLIEDIKNKSVALQECLLTELLDEEFYNVSDYVQSTKDILEMQNLVIQRLIELDTSNKNDYEEYSKMVSQQMIVYSGIEKMDDSKIYADIPSIIKYETDDARRLFEQFALQKKLETNQETLYLFYDPTKERNESSQKASLGMAYYVTDDSLKEISLQLFQSICTPYLKSKFGIGAYLSARIRHGVIDGQLQSGFLEREILLLTSGNQYIPSRYWNINYGLTQDDSQKLHAALTLFSKGLDDIIRKYKDEVLQIKLNDNDKGLFDYRFADDEDVCYYVRCSYGTGCDFEKFCYNLTSMLNTKTNENLAIIKRDIQNRLKPSILNLTDNLLKSVHGYRNQQFETDFRERVEDAKRDIETRLLKMTNWFNITESKLEDFNIPNHILVVWNIVCKMYPRVNCTLRRTSNIDALTPIVLKGEFNVHVSDLFWIFFSNMIKHSKDERNKTFSISHELKGNVLTLKMQNEFEGDEEACNRKIRSLINSMELVDKENGSGLAKSQKIVKYDLKCNKNEVVVLVKNGKCYSTISIDLTPLKK